MRWLSNYQLRREVVSLPRSPLPASQLLLTISTSLEPLQPLKAPELDWSKCEPMPDAKTAPLESMEAAVSVLRGLIES